MSVKRIAILQPLQGPGFEKSSRHVADAARKMAVEANVFVRSEDIHRYEPDFVLVMNHHEPKLTRFPTYGVLASSWLEYQTPRFLRNVLSYDAFFTVSEKVRQWLEDITFGARKLAAPVGFFAATAQATSFEPWRERKQKLVCILDEGVDRHYGPLLKELSLQRYLDTYCLRGASPAPGRGTLKRNPVRVATDPSRHYARSVAGLCLDQHQNFGHRQPSNHLFEVIASGAAVICTRNDFTERWFGDSVLFIEPEAPAHVQVWQIAHHLRWLKENPQEAEKLARRAHSIFVEHLAIEKLLPGVFELHEQVARQKGYVRVEVHVEPESAPRVVYVVRTQGAPHRVLESLRAQTYPRLQSVLIPLRKIEERDRLSEQYKDIGLIVLPFVDENGGAALWRGLREVSRLEGDLFGLLDDCDELFPNHVWSLVRTMANIEHRTWFGPLKLAYAGCVERAATSFGSDRITDLKTLPGERKLRIYKFHFYHPCQLDNGVYQNHPASFLARTELLDDEILTDPEMEEGAEDYLQLLLAEKTLFAFSCEVTSVVHGREDEPREKGSVLTLQGPRLRSLFRTFGRSFPSAAVYMHNVIFQTRFDHDLFAPVICAEHTGEVGRPIPTAPLIAIGGARRRGKILHVPGQAGAGGRLRSLRLTPGRYVLRCYFATPPSPDPTRPLFAIAPSRRDSFERLVVSEASALSSAYARIASLEFDVPVMASGKPMEMRFQAIDNRGFDLLGIQLYRVTRVVEHSLLDLPPKRPLWIYGAGEGGRIMSRKLDLLGIKISGFVDKHKTGIHEGHPIVGLDEARKVINEETILIIASIFWQEIREDLRKHHIVANLYSAYPFAGDTIYALE